MFTNFCICTDDDESKQATIQALFGPYCRLEHLMTTTIMGALFCDIWNMKKMTQQNQINYHLLIYVCGPVLSEDIVYKYMNYAF